MHYLNGLQFIFSLIKMASFYSFHFHSSSSAMAKHTSIRHKASSFLRSGLPIGAGALIALLLVWALCSFFTPNPNPNSNLNQNVSKLTIDEVKPAGEVENVKAAAKSCKKKGFEPGLNRVDDRPTPSFYDDPGLSYQIEKKPMKDWDEKRRKWLKDHPSFIPGSSDRIIVVTGSQSTPCKNPIGDHILLRFFKNKVDYCRIHGYDIFYNNVLFQPKMFSFWAKTPTVKAVMLAHPEAEWVWWIDSDAAFTDMDFKLPLDRYKNHNLVIHGWAHLIHESKSWTGINAGVFLIRNCQWSMDFMERWASMGPQNKDYDKWGEIQRTTFKDKDLPESDDQTGLAYLILKEKEKWGNKIYIESQYYFEGYWMEIVGTYNNISDRYLEIEKTDKRLRRRHAEAVSEGYAKVREEHLKDAGYGRGSWRRPFITHFTGCQPCSGDINQMYSGESCFDAMQQALNFADDQVLRNYGYGRPDLLDPSTVLPVPFDYPA